MEGGIDFRSWDELIPDALGLIFSNLPLQTILTIVPRVCKSWNRTVRGPYCWQEIDIEQWSHRCLPPDHLDRMLQMLISWSSGSLRKLSVSGLQTDSIFSFIAQHAGSLQTLRVPRSKLSNSIVEEVAEKLSSITFLDLSCCCKIGGRAIEAIGKHCKSLVGFSRNMHPIDVLDIISHDDEASAIANTMPKLKRLEIAYLRVSTEAVLNILSSCPNLEFLDLRGCWEVQHRDKPFKEKFPRLRVIGPYFEGYYETIGFWDDYSDYYSDGSEYLAWDLYDDDLDYEEWDDGVADQEPYFWPTSP